MQRLIITLVAVGATVWFGSTAQANATRRGPQIDPAAASVVVHAAADRVTAAEPPITLAHHPGYRRGYGPGYYRYRPVPRHYYPAIPYGHGYYGPRYDHYRGYSGGGIGVHGPGVSLWFSF